MGVENEESGEYLWWVGHSRGEGCEDDGCIVDEICWGNWFTVG